MEFHYQGVDTSGKSIRGQIDATDRRSAISAILNRGHYAKEVWSQSERSPGGSVRTVGRVQKEDLSHKENNRSLTVGARSVGVRSVGGRSGRIGSKDVLGIFKQLGAALHAGLPLLNCLEIIYNQQKKPAMKALMSELIHSVSSGESLSEAMSGKRAFSPLSQAMIRVGETGGILDETTIQLGELLDRDEKIKTKLKNASVYPLIVLTVGLLCVGIVVTWILPRIIGSIAGGVGSLPWPTEVLMGLSEFIKSLWGLATLVMLVGGGYFLRQWMQTEQGRMKWDRFKLKVPLLNRVLIAVAVGRFARTLGALTKGGVTILESLSVVRDTLGNEVLGRQIDKASERVKAGEPLATALEESGYFPPLLIQITAVGEQTGKLDELLLSTADTLEGEADAMLERFMAILPAILILLLAGVVGFIVVGALLPILGMELGPGGI